MRRNTLASLLLVALCVSSTLAWYVLDVPNDGNHFVHLPSRFLAPTDLLHRFLGIGDLWDML